MSATVFALVLVAAAMHAAWNAIVKVSGDRLVMMGILTGVGGVAGLGLIPFVATPAPEAWPYLALTTAIHAGYYLFLLLAYRAGDLSQVYPIARGGSPLLLALLSWPVLGEALSTEQLIGVGLISLGIASLAFGRGDRRSLLFAAATSCTIAAYSATDAVGVRLSGSPLGYIAWLFALDGLMMAGFTLWRRGMVVLHVFRADWWRPVVGGLLSVAGYAIVVWCYGNGLVAPISALRETSVVFAAVIGSVFLGEGFGARRIAAASIVAAGIVVMNGA